MAIRAVVTRGYGNGTFDGSIAEAVLRGYGINEADTTAPILSSPTGTATSHNTASGTVSTDEGNGTLYWFVSTSGTPPSAANLKTGVGAASYGNQSVTGTGTQTVSSITGLTASTGYYIHYLHTDAATNDSDIVTSAQFTTHSAPIPGSVDPHLAGKASMKFGRLN